MAVIDAPLTLPGKAFTQDSKVHKANAKQLEDFALNIFTQLVPVGTILAYAGVTPPTGYLYCNGQAVSRTTYATLFYILGTAYGAGDGNSTFNLPKLDANASNQMFTPVGAGTGVSLGTTNNASNAAGTVLKGVAFNFIIKT